MSTSVLYFIVLLNIQVMVAIDISSHKFYDYCSLSCKFNDVLQPHTVCLRAQQSCAPCSSCTHLQSPSMTDEIRQAILDKHNELRNKVASGQESSQPSAANMNVLNWNMELEFIAQCLANTCDFKHDKCRRTNKFSVGQNLAMMMNSNLDQITTENIVASIQSWYNEVIDMQPKFVDGYPSQYSGPVIGHYTQLVWAEAEYVGCGQALYKKGSVYTMFLVCNYGGYRSSGNLVGGKVYEKGLSCTKCGKKKCNSQFNALCGVITPVQDIEKKGWILGETGLKKGTILMGNGFQ